MSITSPITRQSYWHGAVVQAVVSPAWHQASRPHCCRPQSSCTLARYLAWSSLSKASGPKYLVGVRHFLRAFYPDFDTHRQSSLVQSVIRGSRKVRADPVRRKLPLRPHHLSFFVNRAQSSHAYDDLLFSTILSCAFYACHRMGELVVPSTRALVDWRKIIRRASYHADESTACYHLPYHKGDPFYHGCDIIHLDHPVASPVALLRLYVRCRDAVHGARSALFLRADGSFPTRSWFDSIFFAHLDRSYGGHSARAGGATYYAQLGVSGEVIQALGRWSSSTWHIYVRDNPALRVAIQLVASTSSSSQSASRASSSLTAPVPLTHTSILDNRSRS